MIGSIFFRHPEILLHSLSQMNDGYAGTHHHQSGGVFLFLQKVYIRLFGIPEIGFQVRSMYFRRAIQAVTREAGPGTMLDVGSGIGSYVFELARLFPSARVDGWEIDRKKLAFTRKFANELGMTNVSFAYGDITQKPTVKARYDIVLTVDVLEHIDDYMKALRHMFEILKPGGFLYIHTPQQHQKRFFRSFKTWEHEDHVREGFEPAAFVRDLARLGFTDIHLVHTFGFFGSLAWELNHLLLTRNFVIAGFFYPLLLVLAQLDGVFENKRGLCLSVVARKKS